MKKYLLSVTFYAGSDDSSDIDRGLFLLDVEKEISKEEMVNIFKEVNGLLDPFNEDVEDFPVSYDEGLNIQTLLRGVEIYTKGKVIELCNGYEKLKNIDHYYVIEQWQ